jgi:prepilin-type N-terminal cleavage/methylation domain-containing protein
MRLEMCTREIQHGFTLIELSIVLVIIGLIVGGVLVGRDLIAAAEVRATIAQIEKYQVAVNTFRGKYGYLPGDIRNQEATNFGFAARGQYAGEGDGNGIIEAVNSNAPGNNSGRFSISGEAAMFWSDLTYANGMKLNLIDGSFSTATPLGPPASIAATALGNYLPEAKIGRGNYIYVWSGGWKEWFTGNPPGDNVNYFSIAYDGGVDASFAPYMAVGPGLTVKQAYDIDKKIDDGLPQSGSVMTMYNAWFTTWPAGGSFDPIRGSLVRGGFEPANGAPIAAGSAVATPSSATTCYDNGNVAGAIEQYSIAVSGSGVNCALSFRFQ